MNGSSGPRSEGSDRLQGADRHEVDHSDSRIHDDATEGDVPSPFVLRSAGRQAAPWRTTLRNRSALKSALNTMTARDLAELLEGVSADSQAQMRADYILRLVKEGRGELIATHSAVAFCVDRGAIEGIELRHLYVLPGSRRRGAARALIAKLRAHYQGRRIFCTFADEHWARFARSLGFGVRRRDDGNWQVATDMATLPNTGPDSDNAEGGAPRRPSTLGAGRVLLASALAALATASCIDI